MQPESIRLKPRLRAIFYVVFTLLFLSCVVWWIWHTWVPRRGEFGSEPSPWVPWLLKIHGAAAMAALVLFGVL